jgi:hypothetical protein
LCCTFALEYYLESVILKKSKQWISLILLSLMLIKACVIPLLYLDFEIRRDYIVANLCENRNKPQLKCNGKCYLAKRLAAAQKQEQKQAENDYVSKLLLQPMDLRVVEFSIPAVSFRKSKSVVYRYHPSLEIREGISDIFHPPLLS